MALVRYESVRALTKTTIQSPQRSGNRGKGDAMKRTLSIWTLTLLLTASAGAAALREVAPPIAPPYAAERKMVRSDFVRLQWKDEARSRDVPVKIYFPAEGDGPFPVVLFSHGLGGTREAYEYLGRQWAANGYVVIHLQHPGSDDSAWRGADRPRESMRQAISIQNAVDRAGDAKFAIDQLDRLNRDDPKLKGKLDVKTIAIAGHSFGAHTAMAIAGQGPGRGGATTRPAGSVPSLRDDRVKVAIAMIPNVPILRNNLDAIFAGVKVPVFFMTGTKDDSPLGDTKADERRIPFDHTKNSAAAYLLILAGADHMTFSGRLRADPGDDDFQKQIRLASTAFWDAYLKDNLAAKKWLDEGGFNEALGEKGSFEKK
jgi:dienelactone hydrolase